MHVSKTLKYLIDDIPNNRLRKVSISEDETILRVIQSLSNTCPSSIRKDFLS